MIEELNKVKSSGYSLVEGLLLSSCGFFFGFGIGMFGTFLPIYLKEVYNIDPEDETNKDKI